MACFGACWARDRHRFPSFKRDVFHTPAPSYLAPSGGKASTAEWSSLATPTRTGGSKGEAGFSSPTAQSVAASTVCSFYSAVSRYEDAGDDFDFAESNASEPGPPAVAGRRRMPKAPASVRRFLKFDKEDLQAVDGGGDAAAAADEEGVVPATPSVGTPAPGADPPASPAASSITGPPSPSRADAKPADSAVASFPLNVDEDEDAGEEAGTASPPPALIPARAATAGSDALPPLHTASSVDLGLAGVGAKKAPSPARESAKSTGQAPGLWSRVFSKKGGGSGEGAAKPAQFEPAAAAATAPAASLSSPAASTTAPPVTYLTASGPAGSAGAVEAPARKGIFGW